MTIGENVQNVQGIDVRGEFKSGKRDREGRIRRKKEWKECSLAEVCTLNRTLGWGEEAKVLEMMSFS